MTDQIDILLPSYNGERFISAQIDSLLEQTYKNWRLIIRDDLSSDGTLTLIKRYKEKYPDRIYVMDNLSAKKGIIGSYEALLDASTAPYVALCDQDDVWDQNKLLLQIEKMRKLEERYGGETPILVHTDLSVVDDHLELVSDSLWEYQNFRPDEMCSLPRMLVQNSVTGCTVLANRPLLRLALPFPDGVIMHDWWMALISVSEGIVSDMNAATVKYRQHGENDTGAKKWGLEFIVKWIVLGSEMQRRSLLKTKVQAEALISANILSDNNRAIVERYISMYNRNWFMRRIEMFRMGFFKYGLLKNIAMILRI